jgi:hypothetical protein
MGVYTSINDPSAYFQIATYTGDGNDDRAITNDGNSDLQPDWIWFKNRSTTNSHNLLDSSRGITKRLRSDDTSAEHTTTTRLKSFDSDGMTISTDPSVNGDGNSIVAWQWKANGGTTTSNTDGSITSTVQANTTAGFSIVTYTGAASGSSSFTIGHGLGAVPNWIVIKNRSTATNWQVYHSGLTSGSDGPEHCGVRLNTNDAVNNSDTFWADTLPTSSVFTVRESDFVNKNGDSLVAYCFAEKQGYSKFGSYEGNGNANGTFVYTGFKPAWFLCKQTNTSRSWTLIDSKRPEINSNDTKALVPNESGAEENIDADFLSNGLKIRQNQTAINESGGTYIYAAFAESPFVSSAGVPTTAR